MKKKTCVIMQPTYFPWVGYFNLIQQSDVFVFLNDVQFSKQSWQVKNRISIQGEELMLTVPIKKASLSTKIDQTLIDNSKPWKKKHLKSIYYGYIKSRFFHEVFPIIEGIIMTETNYLFELNMKIIKTISNKILGVKEFIDSRNLNINSKDKLDRILQTCCEVNATEYLSPSGSIAYLESLNYKERFSNASLLFKKQNYTPVEYSQLKTPFKPCLSIIDLLFNKGFEESKIVIQKNSKT